MGTWYEIRSGFMAKPGTTSEILARLIQECRISGEPESLEIGREVTAETRKEKMIMTLNWAGTCSYGLAERIDDDWIRIVTTLADFEVGPVVVTSAGEDYEDSGPITWFIGPARLVLGLRIRNRRGEIQKLQAELAQWEKHLGAAGNQVEVVRP